MVLLALISTWPWFCSSKLRSSGSYQMTSVPYMSAKIVLIISRTHACWHMRGSVFHHLTFLWRRLFSWNTAKFQMVLSHVKKKTFWIVLLLLRCLWKRREVVLEQTVVQAWRDLCFTPPPAGLQPSKDQSQTPPPWKVPPPYCGVWRWWQRSTLAFGAKSLVRVFKLKTISQQVSSVHLQNHESKDCPLQLKPEHKSLQLDILQFTAHRFASVWSDRQKCPQTNKY